MGGTALLLLTLAAASARAATAGDAAQVDARVSEARRTRAAMAPLLDDLVAVRDSYGWETDAARVRARRDAVRGKLEPLAAVFAVEVASMTADIHRYTEEHGLEALQTLADTRRQSPPEVMAFMRAQMFVSEAAPLQRTIHEGLAQEQEAWRRFESLERERRSFRRTLWAVCGAFLASLAVISWAFMRAVRRRSRRGGKDVINVRAE